MMQWKQGHAASTFRNITQACQDGVREAEACLDLTLPGE